MPLSYEWLSDADNAMNLDWANGADISIDANGNAVVVGTFQGDNIRITSGNFDFNDEGNDNAASMWIASFFPNQDLNWLISARCSTSTEDATGIAVASGSASSYVTGIFEHNLDLGVGENLTHENPGQAISTALPKLISILQKK